MQFPSMVLNIIKGYQIPFAKPPSQSSPARVDAIDVKNIDLEVKKLLSMGAIVECEPQQDQFLSPIFLVPKPNGTLRFIFNLKKLNQFIANDKFKMEDLRTAIRLLTPHCFMASIDLKDAYYSIPVHQNSRKFLRFQFNSKTFEFTCLPFGICTAPRIFTKVMKPVVAYLRKQGIICVVYLDDILIIDQDYQTCKKKVKTTLTILQKLGFIVNYEKSNLDPCQSITFLGFILNSVKMTVSLTSAKRLKLKELSSKILQNRKIRILQLAEYIGFLISCIPAVPYGLLYTKYLERLKVKSLAQANNDYRSYILITNREIKEIQWWQNLGFSTEKAITQDKYNLEIYTDACLTGWGAHCNSEKINGQFVNEELNNHINYLELLAVYKAVKYFANSKSNVNILLHIDNKTALSCINRMGSIKYKHFLDLTKKIWQFLERRDSKIFAVYIRSKDNYIADAESRKLRPETEWSLSQKAFHSIKCKFGEPVIDLFATKMNTKCEMYFSWHWDDKCSGIDAFTHDWSKYFFYAFPPFSLITRVLQKIRSDLATGIVVVPKWDTQPWFPCFNELLISDLIILPPKPNLLTYGNRSHPLSAKLTLMAGILSGRRTN